MQELCGYDWVDECPPSPDDDCGSCGRHCSPWRTEKLDADGNVVEVRESIRGDVFVGLKPTYG
jgi:hypothetical protein